MAQICTFSRIYKSIEEVMLYSLGLKIKLLQVVVDKITKCSFHNLKSNENINTNYKLKS